MAKKKKADLSPEAPAAPAAPAAAPKPALTLEARVAELEGDLRRICGLLSDAMGEPFKSAAAEILSKHQGR